MLKILFPVRCPVKTSKITKEQASTNPPIKANKRKKGVWELASNWNNDMVILPLIKIDSDGEYMHYLRNNKKT